MTIINYLCGQRDISNKWAVRANGMVDRVETDREVHSEWDIGKTC